MGGVIGRRRDTMEEARHGALAGESLTASDFEELSMPSHRLLLVPQAGSANRGVYREQQLGTTHFGTHLPHRFDMDTARASHRLQVLEEIRWMKESDEDALQLAAPEPSYFETRGCGTTMQTAAGMLRDIHGARVTKAPSVPASRWVTTEKKMTALSMTWIQPDE